MMQMLQFQEERLFGAANMIKGLEHCIDVTIEYCKERRTFGQPLIDNQVIHFRMAEMMTEVEALRALVYQATELYVKGRDVTRLASMAKLKAGRLGREVSDACLQYWGGMGFMWDNPVSRAYRDTRLVSIGGGADEIMLGIICKLMGILRARRKADVPGGNRHEPAALRDPAAGTRRGRPADHPEPPAKPQRHEPGDGRRTARGARRRARRP
ncbi:putative citronellyl-CoA dehydrogenase involved in catabolism of citronellol [Pseudomonas aeruginosa]|nr:putative citronellyl-CoA dehydrogenase involved in catabolism of citronellol [Pseudomonas aeruginosa]